jgi:ribose-phosphate pyrophosphokinase
VSERNTTAVPVPSSTQVGTTNDGPKPTTQVVTSSEKAGQPKQAVEPVAKSTDGLAASAAGTKAASEKKRSSRLTDDKRFKIFSGSANRPLTEEICKFLGVPVGETRLQRFSDGETHFQLLENVRGVDVFLVQPTCHPVDRNLVELLIMMDALKRATTAMRVRTVKIDRVWQSHQSWWLICSRQPEPTARSSLICMQPRFKASSISL